MCIRDRDFMPLFEPGAQTALYGPVQWSGRLRTLLGMMQSAESEPERDVYKRQERGAAADHPVWCRAGNRAGDRPEPALGTRPE